jgi:hypothetical protein
MNDILAKRIAIPEDAVNEVLIRSRRRCCFCFGLHQDVTVKQGQIAHLDQDRNNIRPDNLAFLCLPHHDSYDTRTSQSKGLTIGEARSYRAELYAYMQTFALKALALSGTFVDTAEDQEEALQFYTGTHRSRSAVLLLQASGPRSVEEINAQIPPSDLEWTRSILSEPIERGWIRRKPSDYGRFELTMNGRRMLEVLAQLSNDLKERALTAVWRPDWVAKSGSA